jgi:hypothetical protein
MNIANIRLTRICAGAYEYTIRNTVFTIERNDERDSTWYGEWIISEHNDSYSDPMPSLQRCREALAHMEANPALYQIRCE